VQLLLFDLALLRAGQFFHSLLETSGFAITVLQIGSFLFCCQPSLAIRRRTALAAWREEFPLPWQYLIHQLALGMGLQQILF
jgi:hypothetical protein